MPFYYAINPGGLTTASLANSATSHVRPVTVANQRPAIFTGIHLCPSFGTVGAIELTMLLPTAFLGSGGSAFTPAKRDPSGPAAGLTVFTAPVTEAGSNNMLTVGANQGGASGQWSALKVDAGIWFQPNGVAGSARSIASTASVLFDLTLEFLEGP